MFLKAVFAAIWRNKLCQHDISAYSVETNMKRIPKQPSDIQNDEMSNRCCTISNSTIRIAFKFISLKYVRFAVSKGNDSEKCYLYTTISLHSSLALILYDLICQFKNSLHTSSNPIHSQHSPNSP